MVGINTTSFLFIPIPERITWLIFLCILENVDLVVPLGLVSNRKSKRDEATRYNETTARRKYTWLGRDWAWDTRKLLLEQNRGTEDGNHGGKHRLGTEQRESKTEENSRDMKNKMKKVKRDTDRKLSREKKNDRNFSCWDSRVRRKYLRENREMDYIYLFIFEKEEH